MNDTTSGRCTFDKGGRYVIHGLGHRRRSSELPSCFAGLAAASLHSV